VKLFADFFTLVSRVPSMPRRHLCRTWLLSACYSFWDRMFSQAYVNVLFKSSTSLFGSQATQVSDAARMVYTVNDPLCGTEGTYGDSKSKMPRSNGSGLNEVAHVSRSRPSPLCGKQANSRHGGHLEAQSRLLPRQTAHQFRCCATARRLLELYCFGERVRGPKQRKQHWQTSCRRQMDVGTNRLQTDKLVGIRHRKDRALVMRMSWQVVGLLYKTH